MSNSEHPGHRRAKPDAWARPASHKAPPGGTYTGSELDYRGKQPARPQPTTGKEQK